MPFDQNHLNYLRATIERDRDGRLPPQPAVGRIPAHFAAIIGAGQDAPGLPTSQMTRRGVATFCSNRNHTALSCFLVVMAWGAMRHDHGRAAFEAHAEWEQGVNELRTIRHTRRQAYDRLQELRAANQLPGVGPAYFTKLIHFFLKSDGYIMDQWTARSINLLAGKPVVPLIRAVHRRTGKVAVAVAQDVGGEVYETFCALVDELAEKLKLTGEETERLLFSHGGWVPGRWRTYVRAQDVN